MKTIENVEVVVLIDNQWVVLDLTKFSVEITPQGKKFIVEGYENEITDK